MSRMEVSNHHNADYPHNSIKPAYFDLTGISPAISSYNTPNVKPAYTPMVSDYKSSPPLIKEEHFNDYGINAHTPTKFVYSSPTKVELQYTDNGMNDHNRRRPSSPVYDRPQEVEEFITKIQTEVFQPTRIAPFGGTCCRNPDNPTNPIGYDGEYRNFINDKEGDYYHRIEYLTQPTLTKVGVFGRPTGHLLTSPTNDKDEVVNFLKEAFVKSSPFTIKHHRREPLGSRFPETDIYIETPNNKEAPRRNARPMKKTGDCSYPGIINNSDTVKKYGGAFEP